MTVEIEIILLVASIAFMIILWAGLDGIEVSGSLSVGLISLAIGVIGLCNFQKFDARFGVSTGFVSLVVLYSSGQCGNVNLGKNSALRYVLL